MTRQLPIEETVTFEEVAISNSFEIAALVNVLECKGLLSRQDVIAEIGILSEQANI
jgi:hypothetical protein